MYKEIIIASRGSKLALTQAEWVKKSLEGFYPEINFIIKKIKTSGDMITGVPLPKIGTKGLFTKEIEESLILRESHIAVHSMKDLPTETPPGLAIGAITKREDPHDCLISRDNLKLSDMPRGAKIGTSSLRRSSQLLIFRPDFKIINLRGNLTTRMTKLYKEDLDAIVVALAGVRRLGMEDKITEVVPFEVLMPAVGQGALGVEAREDDKDVIEMVRRLDDKPSHIAIEAERSFLKKMGGGCQVPIGSIGEVIGEKLMLKGIVSSTDGKRVLRAGVTGDKRDYKAIGERLALELLSKGAREILKSSPSP